MTHDRLADCQYVRFVPLTHVEAEHQVGGVAKMDMQARAYPVQRTGPTSDKREEVKSPKRANKHLPEINDMAGPGVRTLRAVGFSEGVR